MSDIHGSTLYLERAAIVHAAQRLNRELEGGYTQQATRSVSFFVTQLLNSARSIHYASENMPSAMAEATSTIPDKRIEELLNHACLFRGEAMKVEGQRLSSAVLQDFKMALSKLGP